MEGTKNTRHALFAFGLGDCCLLLLLFELWDHCLLLLILELGYHPCGSHLPVVLPPPPLAVLRPPPPLRPTLPRLLIKDRGLAESILVVRAESVIVGELLLRGTETIACRLELRLA